MSAVKRKAARAGGGLLAGTLSFLIIAAALAFGVSVFFRVSHITAVGSNNYSQEEIIEASGIDTGDNLIFLNRSAVEKQISEKLIYIGTVKVSRKLPSTVIIDVSESGVAASIETESGPWLIDSGCRLLESCSYAKAEEYTRIIGFSALTPKMGELASAGEEDKPKIAYLQEILAAMSVQEMLSDVSMVDVSNIANGEFEYLGRFKVKLGRQDNTEYKLGLLKSAVAQLGEQEHGIMDLSENKRAQFSPE